MLASYGHEGLRGHGAKGETGPCPGHDPLARPATVVGVLSEEGFGVGMEKMHSSANWRGPLAAAAGEADKRAGEQRAADARGQGGSDRKRADERAGDAGPLAGPCAR